MAPLRKGAGKSHGAKKMYTENVISELRMILYHKINSACKTYRLYESGPHRVRLSAGKKLPTVLASC